MHRNLKVSIALLVLSVRMWKKLAFLRYIVPESLADIQKLSPIHVILAFSLLYLLFFLFNKIIAPIFWRANLMHNGIYLTNNWVPILGQMNVLTNLK